MVSCYRLLGDRFFTLKVRSLSGKDVPVSLYQMNVILCPDKKGKGPKTQLSPSRVSVLAKRRQISVGSSLRARFPDSAQLSSLKEPGTQPNQLLGSSGRPERGGDQVPQTWTQADCHCYLATETGLGRGSLLPQGLGQG